MNGELNDFLTHAHSDEFIEDFELPPDQKLELVHAENCAWHFGGDCNCEVEMAPDDEPWDGFRDDVEADANALGSAGYGEDEYYTGGCYIGEFGD